VSAAHVIGADVGSQSVKAVLMDPDGTVLGCASRPCSMSHPMSGWAEQRPGDWRDSLAGAVRDVRERAGVAAGEVAALGLACQVDGMVAMDDRGDALRPAIIWLDRRGEAQATRFADRVGAARLAELTGLQPDASHSAPKAMWLLEHEPEAMRDARWLAPVASYLVGWLTGAVVQDHANASSSMLYDLHARAWSPELADAAGLDVERLPTILPSHETAGSLTAAAAEALGLTRDCVVAVGTGDDHAATVGAGAHVPGVVVDVTGTAEPVTTPAARAVVDGEGLVETHAHAIDEMLLVENPGFVSGGSTAWLAGILGMDSQAEIFARAQQAPAGSEGVLFLPALSGAMTPRWNAAMRGCFGGLALGQHDAHLCRAVLEGCAYALRDIVDRFDALGVGADELRVVGGGARSRLWMQIKADVTGRPVRRVMGEEATATGAAMLAAVAAGTFDDLPAAMDRLVSLDDEVFRPDPACADVYAEGYARYRGLYDAVEGVLA
jgi:xylulokinase